MRARWLALLVAGLALTACVRETPSVYATPPQPPEPQDRCTPAATTLESRAGRQWLQEHGWRYRDRDAAQRAYRAVLDESSPWPDWFIPQDTTLPIGTRMQMALAPDQPANRPGGYATFDRVATIQQARDNLAVRKDWKPAISRVAIYETIAPMPVRIGPIASQIDPGDCRLLIGRWSQIEFRVPYNRRMDYLVIIDEYPIR